MFLDRRVNFPSWWISNHYLYSVLYLGSYPTSALSPWTINDYQAGLRESIIPSSHSSSIRPPISVKLGCSST